jgi:DNA-directed RNA polymerase specialized sigma24 family protein
VVLRYIEDLDVDTVAHVLGMPTNTVKSHAARGLAALREGLSLGREAEPASMREFR